MNSPTDICQMLSAVLGWTIVDVNWTVSSPAQRITSYLTPYHHIILPGQTTAQVEVMRIITRLEAVKMSTRVDRMSDTQFTEFNECITSISTQPNELSGDVFIKYTLTLHEEPTKFFEKLYEKHYDEQFIADLEETLAEEV